MDFINIDELYSFLELNTIKSTRQWELTRDFKKLEDYISEEKIKEKIRWESFAFDFALLSGGVEPATYSTKEDGTTIYSYPSYNEFSEDTFNYLKERAKTVKSNFLIARYNQVLWNSNSKHKHQQQAKNAIDAYLRILSTLNCVDEENNQGWDCLEILKNGFGLAIQIKYKIEEHKTLIKSWLFDRGKFHQDLKPFLLEYMLTIPQFKKADFEGSLELITKLGIAHKKKKTDYFDIKDIYTTGLKIAQRFGSDTKIWNKRIGDAIVRMAEYRMDDKSRIVPLNFFKEAIQYYKEAKLDKKVKEVEQKYFELKKELKLAKIEIPLHEEHVEILRKYNEDKAEHLLEHTPEQIFGYLLSGGDIFPNKKSLDIMAKDKENSFLNFITTMKFDINKNVSKEKNSKEEKQKSITYENYHYYINMSVLPLLHRIFIEGIKKGKITYANLVKFILEHTWLGQEFIDTDSAGDSNKYTWISVIAPSLHEYFLQTETALKSNNLYPNYIMPIDSLTLKFEGVLRDFAKIVKVSTTTIGKGNVLREKYIEELLLEDEIKKYFNENDLLFFNYLFVSKNGMNLRNNIAHSFFRFNNYSFQFIHLLICAFLRIGKYRMSAKHKSTL